MERSCDLRDILGQNQQGLGGLRDREGSRMMLRFLAQGLGRITVLSGRGRFGGKGDEVCFGLGGMRGLGREIWEISLVGFRAVAGLH